MTISFKPYLGGGVVMDVPEMETLYKTREQYKKSKSVVDGDAYFKRDQGTVSVPVFPVL